MTASSMVTGPGGRCGASSSTADGQRRCPIGVVSAVKQDGQAVVLEHLQTTRPARAGQAGHHGLVGDIGHAGLRESGDDPERHGGIGGLVAPQERHLEPPQPGLLQGEA